MQLLTKRKENRKGIKDTIHKAHRESKTHTQSVPKARRRQTVRRLKNQTDPEEETTMLCHGYTIANTEGSFFPKQPPPPKTTIAGPLDLIWALN